MNDLFAIHEPLRDDWPDDYAMQFWDAWPAHFRKHSKKQAMKKLAAIRAAREVTWAQLAGGLGRYVASNPNYQFIPAPTVWLNQQRWMADYSKPERPKTFGDVMMGRG